MIMTYHQDRYVLIHKNIKINKQLQSPYSSQVKILESFTIKYYVNQIEILSLSNTNIDNFS